MFNQSPIFLPSNNFKNLTTLKFLTKETLDEEAEKLMSENNNPRFKKVYDAYENFRKNYELWGGLSDKAYQESLELE